LIDIQSAFEDLVHAHQAGDVEAAIELGDQIVDTLLSSDYVDALAKSYFEARQGLMA
jgi:hypothetical protein